MMDHGRENFYFRVITSNQITSFTLVSPIINCSGTDRGHAAFATVAGLVSKASSRLVNHTQHSLY